MLTEPWREDPDQPTCTSLHETTRNNTRDQAMYAALCAVLRQKYSFQLAGSQPKSSKRRREYHDSEHMHVYKTCPSAQTQSHTQTRTHTQGERERERERQRGREGGGERRGRGKGERWCHAHLPSACATVSVVTSGLWELEKR
jgi:hypothetical protein